ncbi:MAG: ATP-binding protein [Candidatus Aenigmarchaeota archaeon]|nr:ATP-binding protein [Candidatus Aenigmarchaeota archaeon]
MKYIEGDGIPKTEKYVISGGPGCGKTTIVEELERRNYYIIPEPARQIIDREEKIGGNLLPWDDRRGFQKAVIELQKEQEYNLPSTGTIFLDRSMLDNLAYLRLDGIEPSEELYGMFNKFNNYSTVFLPEPLPKYVNDNARKEDEKTARDIHNRLVAN